MENYYKTVRKIISDAGSQFIGIEFKKKSDGSNRVLNVQQPAIKNHIKGDKAEEQYIRAAKTRKDNNPNIMNVYSRDKQAIRSFDMNTLIRITVAGKTYTREQIEEMSENA